MLDNPNDEVLPDFTTDEHQDARTRLINRGIADEALAAEALAAIWTLNNEAAKDFWADQEETRLRQAQEAEQRLAEQEQEKQQALEDELTAARKEEHKKNKAKFVPVSAAKTPTIPIVIPSNYAIRKLKAGDYCELFYFTNRGLSEARKNLLSTEPQGMILLPGSDGQQVWVNADNTRDAKTVITKDENLSWEEFNEAAPRMILAMKQQEWPDDRVDMHISFWTALQNHRWRHAMDTLKQRALLLYQSQQRRLWHLTAGGPLGWSIAELNPELILEAREEIFNLDRDLALAMLKQVEFHSKYLKYSPLIYFVVLIITFLHTHRAQPQPSPFDTMFVRQTSQLDQHVSHWPPRVTLSLPFNRAALLHHQPFNHPSVYPRRSS
ncbi:hypothetical protein CY34DRAFT_97268 [Suillus luteus UH-Slu-Lm8-n1]|uniref:Uncharacterized protein n=1 Tax=Suillus luteus UH-Slu-Lm8-n1 TaxID=930992 RepID=A0A0C9ZB78_9AGAM|nr:hypothetical protein CY34DRAFT_97268 [Suillus luteus UH-Slu-Lm8-n1]